MGHGPSKRGIPCSSAAEQLNLSSSDWSLAGDVASATTQRPARSVREAFVAMQEERLTVLEADLAELHIKYPLVEAAQATADADPVPHVVVQMAAVQPNGLPAPPAWQQMVSCSHLTQFVIEVIFLVVMVGIVWGLSFGLPRREASR